jgi:hypothetical protein
MSQLTSAKDIGLSVLYQPKTVYAVVCSSSFLEDSLLIGLSVELLGCRGVSKSEEKEAWSM